MYTEIDSMKDMMEINLKRKEYRPVLLLSRFTDIDTVTTKEAQYLLRLWKEELKGFLSEEDAGCVINSGNVLVLVREKRAEDFIRSIRGLTLHIQAKGSAMQTDAMILSDDMSRLFLTYA